MHRAFIRRVGVAHVVVRGRDNVGHEVCVAQQHAASVRQVDSARRPLDQLSPEGGFEFAYASADRGHGSTQFLGCCGHASEFRNGPEYPYTVPIERLDAHMPPLSRV